MKNINNGNNSMNEEQNLNCNLSTNEISQQETISINTLANDAIPATEEEDLIPETVYDNLPSLLKESCNVFNDWHEKDVYLTGILSVLGGCFHNLYAYNEVDKKRVATNLLAIIVAPSASGKGALNYLKQVSSVIKTNFAEKSKQSGVKEPNNLFIPANISSAGMIQLLSKNKGVGVMVESEIDTLVNANRQEWGNYSELLRKSFENEDYSMYRKGNGKPEFLEVESLKLSLAISGTQNQFKLLMYSAENGLFSRGTYYVFDSNKLNFMGRMNSEVDLNEKFASFAKIADEYYEKHLGFDKIEVLFSEQNLKVISETLQEISISFGGVSELQANIKRGFVMAQKIAALLTFLNECEKDLLKEKLCCTEETIKTAMILIQTYLSHAYNAYQLLPNKLSVKLTESQERLLLILPPEFTKKEGAELAKGIGLCQRTGYYAIQALSSKKLIKLKANGMYKKQ